MLEDYTKTDKTDGYIYFNNINRGIKKQLPYSQDIRLYQGLFYNFVTNPDIIVYPAIANEKSISCNSGFNLLTLNK